MKKIHPTSPDLPSFSKAEARQITVATAEFVFLEQYGGDGDERMI